MRTWGHERKRARGRPGTRREREEGSLSHSPYAPPRHSTSQGVPAGSRDPSRPPPAGPGSAGSRVCRIGVCGTRTRGTKVCGARVHGVEFRARGLRMARGGVRSAGTRRSLGLPAQGGQDRSSPGGCAEGGRGPSAVAPTPAGPPPRPPSAAALALRRSRKVCTDPDPAAPRRRAVTGARPERARRTAGSRAEPPAAPRGEHLGRGPEGTFGSRASGGRDCGAGAAGLGGAGRREPAGRSPGPGLVRSSVPSDTPVPNPGSDTTWSRTVGQVQGSQPLPRSLVPGGGRGWGRGCRWLPGALRRPHSPLWAPGPPPWERTKRRGRAPEARGLTSSRSPRRAPAPRTARWHRRGPGRGEGCLRPTWPLLCRGPHWRL